MKTKLSAQFRAGEAAIAQRGEEAKGDSREQNFGISGPKAVCRIGSGAGGDVVMIFDFALKRKFATCLRSGSDRYHGASRDSFFLPVVAGVPPANGNPQPTRLPLQFRRE